MSEVAYSVNHYPFKEDGIFVSESKGIADALKRKKVQTYSWAEYHGSSDDLKNPKYESREIELKCFVEGENWEQMHNRFSSFTDKFQKSGTQRLHITPFEYKTLPYEVYLQDDVNLEKGFKKGRMVGVFSIKLIEPNPRKIVLKTSLDKFKLSYESTTETELFFGDGTKQTARGNVSMTKSYSAPSYQSSGITLVSISGINNTFYEAYVIPTEENAFQFSVEANLISSKNMILYVIGRKFDNTYEAVAISEIFEGKIGSNKVDVVQELNMNDYGKFIFKVLDSDGLEIPSITYSNARIEKAEIIGEWQNMIGKEKVIIIAGNIEDIKNLNTEAEILWDKL